MLYFKMFFLFIAMHIYLQMQKKHQNNIFV